MSEWASEWVSVSISQWWPAWSTDWLSYRPGDFLMFAPRTYWRLFERHNQSVGPAIWLIWALGLAALWRLRRPNPSLRALEVSLALALAWAAVGWYFLHQLYAPVFWVMTWAAWAFLTQALLLGGMAVLALSKRGTPRHAEHAAPSLRNGGLVLVGWAVLIHPLLAPLAERPWAQAEIIGLAPDPTVFATLGLLLCMRPPAGAARVPYELMWALALAWCAVSAATLWTMSSMQAYVPVLVGAGALAWRIRHGKPR